MDYLTNFYKNKVEQLQEKYNNLLILLEDGAEEILADDFASKYTDAEFEEFIRRSEASGGTPEQISFFRRLREQGMNRRRQSGTSVPEEGAGGRARRVIDPYLKQIKSEGGRGLGVLVAGAYPAKIAGGIVKDAAMPEIVKSGIEAGVHVGSGAAIVDKITKPKIPMMTHLKTSGKPGFKYGFAGAAASVPIDWLQGYVGQPEGTARDVTNMAASVAAVEAAAAAKPFYQRPTWENAKTLLRGGAFRTGLYTGLGAIASPIISIMPGIDKTASAEVVKDWSPEDIEKRRKREIEAAAMNPQDAPTTQYVARPYDERVVADLLQRIETAKKASSEKEEGEQQSYNPLMDADEVKQKVSDLAKMRMLSQGIR